MNPFVVHPLMKSYSTLSEERDRRIARRYPLSLSLEYYLVRRHKVLESGRGRTLNISTGGILIETPRGLPLAASIELHISWPASLAGEPGLELGLTGRTVRAEGNQTAISVGRYEFFPRNLRLSSPGFSGNGSIF
jgi:hypothetical protein